MAKCMHEIPVKLRAWNGPGWSIVCAHCGTEPALPMRNRNCPSCGQMFSPICKQHTPRPFSIHTAIQLAKSAMPEITPILGGLHVVTSPKVEAMCISADLVMVVGENILEGKRWNVMQAAGVVLHECCHLLKRHASRAKLHGVHPPEGTLVKKATQGLLNLAWNLGGDAEINHMLHQYLQGSQYAELPPDGVYPESLDEEVRYGQRAKSCESYFVKALELLQAEQEYQEQVAQAQLQLQMEIKQQGDTQPSHEPQQGGAGMGDSEPDSDPEDGDSEGEPEDADQDSEGTPGKQDSEDTSGEPDSEDDDTDGADGADSADSEPEDADQDADGSGKAACSDEDWDEDEDAESLDMEMAEDEAGEWDDDSEDGDVDGDGQGGSVQRPDLEASGQVGHKQYREPTDSLPPETLEKIRANLVKAFPAGGSCADGIPRDFEPVLEKPKGQAVPGLPDTLERQVDRLVASACQNVACSGRGTMGEFSALMGIQDARKVRISGREKLRNVIRKACWDSIGGRGKRTFSRLSRFSQPGCPMPVTRSITPRITLIIDTSGSMEWGNRLSMAVSCVDIIRELYSDQKGIQVITGDTAGKSITLNVKNAQQMLRKLVGGGGTDMRNIVLQVLESKPLPELIIVATDMDTPWPQKQDMKKVPLVIAGCNPSKYDLERKSHPAWATTIILKDEEWNDDF